MTNALFYLASASLVTWLILKIWHTFRRRLPVPPGPRPLPLIGNFHQMPTSDQHLKLRQWKDTYGQSYPSLLVVWIPILTSFMKSGPLVFVVVLGAPILYLNKYEDAKELLDGRGAIYSDRPRLEMAGEL